MAKSKLPTAANDEQQWFLKTLEFKKAMYVLAAVNIFTESWERAPAEEKLGHLAMMAIAHDQAQLGEPFFKAVVAHEIKVAALSPALQEALQRPFDHLAVLAGEQRLRERIEQDGDRVFDNPPSKYELLLDQLTARKLGMEDLRKQANERKEEKGKDHDNSRER